MSAAETTWMVAELRQGLYKFKIPAGMEISLPPTKSLVGESAAPCTATTNAKGPAPSSPLPCRLCTGRFQIAPVKSPRLRTQNWQAGRETEESGSGKEASGREIRAASDRCGGRGSLCVTRVRTAARVQGPPTTPASCARLSSCAQHAVAKKGSGGQ